MRRDQVKSYRVYGEGGWVDIIMSSEGTVVQFSDRYGVIVSWDDWKTNQEVSAMMMMVGELFESGTDRMRELARNFPSRELVREKAREIHTTGQGLEERLRALVGKRKMIVALSKTEASITGNREMDILMREMAKIIETMFKDRWGDV